MTASKAPSKKSGGSQTILWWVVWISLTIGSFFVAAVFWTPIIAKHFGSVRETRASIAWVASVFGTWMVILVPLIIVMYSKVDKVYEDARIRREKNAARFRSIFVEPGKRAVPPAVTQKLTAWPQTIAGGHLVNVRLKNGTTVDNVYIFEGKEVLGIYNAADLTFEGNDVADVEPVDFKKTPAFLANLWLRLDGVPPRD
jgi:hypothetical protein